LKKIAFFAFVLLIILFLLVSSFSNDEKATLKYETVKKLSFDLTLNQRGILQASRFVQIKSKILSNRAKLVELIPEGTEVNAGEIIARYDTKPFQDELDKWIHKEKEAQAAYIKAQKEVEIHKNKSINDVQKLKKSIEIMKINLSDINYGEGKVTFNEHQQTINKAKRKVLLSQEELNDYNALYEKGYISKRERDKVNNTLKDNEEALLNAQEKFKSYKKYEWPREIKEVEIKLQDLKEELENTKIQNQFELDNKKSQLFTAGSILLYYQSEIKKEENNLFQCDVRSPIDGVVLYNTVFKAGKKTKLEIGDNVWYGQSFLQIPDTKKMIVTTKIREIDLNKINENLNVNVILDSYPNKVFHGKITYIDSVAKNDAQVSDIKFFETIVEIETKDKLLRSGMSASIAISYDEVVNRIAIANGSINYDGKSEYVLINNDGDMEKRYIKLGKMGKEFSEVVSGLKENEVIVVK